MSVVSLGLGEDLYTKEILDGGIHDTEDHWKYFHNRTHPVKVETEKELLAHALQKHKECESSERSELSKGFVSSKFYGGKFGEVLYRPLICRVQWYHYREETVVVLQLLLLLSRV